MKNLIFMTLMFGTPMMMTDQAIEVEFSKLLENCSNSAEKSAVEIASYVERATSRQIYECVMALLENDNFNTRNNALKAISNLKRDQKIIILKLALGREKIWISPNKNGEQIAEFSILVENYCEIFKSIGVQATELQLLSIEGRKDLIESVATTLPN